MLSEIEQFIDHVRIHSPQAKTWRDYKCNLELFCRRLPRKRAGNGELPKLRTISKNTVSPSRLPRRSLPGVR